MFNTLIASSPQFKLFGFRNLDALVQIRVQTNTTRTLDPHLSERTEAPRRRIHKQESAIGIGDCLVAELAIEPVVPMR